MSGLPMLTAREVIRALERAGFQVQRQTGSHARLRHTDGRVVTVPIHARQGISRGLLRKIPISRVRSLSPISHCTKSAPSMRLR
jgi:predicted RNA binding protein YcfA (HicA-like mRNA interferase family)